MLNEVHLQKCLGCEGGELYGSEESVGLYKGLLSFVIVGLKGSVPYIVKSLPETKVEADWMKDEILACVKILHDCWLWCVR